jgi:hypothetical protein
MILGSHIGRHPCRAGSLLCLLFNSEDGGQIFLRNVVHVHPTAWRYISYDVTLKYSLVR